jgi:hypothetical protein
MAMGDQTKAVSTRTALLREKNVTGKGEPSHTPEIEAQTYIDVDTGYVYQWWAGTWSHT